MCLMIMITYILCSEKLLKSSNVTICQVHDMDVVSDLFTYIGYFYKQEENTRHLWICGDDRVKY